MPSISTIFAMFGNKTLHGSDINNHFSAFQAALRDNKQRRQKNSNFLCWVLEITKIPSFSQKGTVLGNNWR